MVKIAFTSEEASGLESVMSYHFGHAPYFVIVDVEGNKVLNVQSVKNPFAESHSHGDVPRFLHELGVNMVVSGGMGERAIEIFNSYGIDVVTDAFGKVKDVLNEILTGALDESIEEEVNTSHEAHETHEHSDIEMLKKDVEFLRKELANLKSKLLEIEKKLNS